MRMLLYLIFLLLTFSAYSDMPLKITKVQPNDEMKGIRYELGRPSYEAKLNFWWAKTEEKQSCVFTITVAQNLKGPSILYEASSPEFSGLSSTNFSLTLDDKGKLSAFSGSETSIAKETVEAVAGLAVAVTALDNPDWEKICKTNHPELIEYVTKQIDKEEGLKKLKTGLAFALANFPTGSAPSFDQVQAIQALREEIETQEKLLLKHSFDLKKHVVICLDNCVKSSSADSKTDTYSGIFPNDPVENPWFVVSLKNP